MSSSKLQHCLELCRFIQALLKTKVARWKVHFLVRVSKRLMYIIRRNGWRITRGTQPERRMLHLESRCYNKSDPGPKALASQTLMSVSLSSFVSKPCLTFLSIVYILSTPNQVYSLVCIQYRVILHCFLCSPSLRKSWDEISFKGEGCNSLYYGFC
jgi:hypothetical protein